MLRCPNCGRELVPDESNPGKMLCFGCMKRYSEEVVEQLREMQGEPPVVFEDCQLPEERQNDADASARTVDVVVPIPVEPNASSSVGYPMPHPQQDAVIAPMQTVQKPVVPAPAPFPTQTTVAVKPEKPTRKSKGLAIASIVVAVLAAGTCWFPLASPAGIALGVIALALGIAAVVKAVKGKAGLMGLGIAAMAIGTLSAIMAVAMTFLTGAIFDIGFGILGSQNSNSNTSIVEYEHGEDPSTYYENVISDYGYNANSNANASSNHNSNANEPSPDPANWTDEELIVDGAAVKVGKTTLSEFVAATGWVVSETSSIKATDRIMSGESVWLSMSHVAYKNSCLLLICVENDTPGDADVLDCAIGGFDIYLYAEPMGDIPQIQLGQIVLGETTLAQVKGMLGEPDSSYEQDDVNAQYDWHDVFLTVSYEKGNQVLELQTRNGSPEIVGIHLSTFTRISS